jgi:hypothetical protein
MNMELDATRMDAAVWSYGGFLTVFFRLGKVTTKKEANVAKALM